jgi:chromosome segregation ATPase
MSDTSAEAVKRLIAGANGIPAFAPHNDTLRALLAERDHARKATELVIGDTATELGCAPDNEAILKAIAALKAERDRLATSCGHCGELERAFARAEKAEAERDEALRLAKRHMDEKHRTKGQAAEDWDVLQQRIKTTEAERDRLREALRALADIDGSSANVASAEVLASRVRNCARAALGEDRA